MTRAVLLCSVVLVAPFAMADTPTPPVPPSQTATPPAPAPTPMQTRDAMRARRQADHEAFLSARLAALHAGLQLKPEQEGLWMPVETAIRDFAKLRAARWADRMAARDDAAGASPDALRQRADRLIARGNAMKALADATGPLLAQLDVEQKERLPMLLDGLQPRRVLARAFALEDRREMQAWRDEGRGGWDHGHRHGPRAEHAMRDRDDGDGDDRRAERFERDHEDGMRFDQGRRHHGWDDGDHDDHDGDRDDRAMHSHHHDDDEPDRT